jgi:hypothetical protein
MDELDILQYLADAQDGIGKALRFLSRIKNGQAPHIADIWREATRVQRYITDAQEDMRREPETPDDDRRAA